MKLANVQLENFRSIENTELSLDGYNILIGKNNAGKSNLANSLTSYRTLLLPDDHPDSKGAEEVFRNSVRDDEESANIRFSVDFVLTAEEKESLIEKISAAHSLSDSFVRKAEENEYFSKITHTLAFGADGVVHNDVATNYCGDLTTIGERRERTSGGKTEIQFSFIDFEALPEVEYVEASTVDSPINAFPESYRSTVQDFLDEWEWVAPFRKPEYELPVTATTELDEGGGNLSQVLLNLRQESPPRFDEIEQEYKAIMEGVENIRAPLSSGNGETRVNILVDERNIEGVQLEDISSGSKEILILVTNIVLARGSTEVLFIEEPELHLHPAAVQEIFSLIKKAVNETDTQVIVTTHSDVFVNRIGIDQITSVYRDPYTQCSQVREYELQKELENRGVKNSELVQSEKVVFVEGPSDKLILERWADQCGFPLEGHRITVITTNGEGDAQNQDPATRVLRQMDIPYLFVFDNHGDPPREVLREKSSELGESPQNIQVWDEFAIESYLVDVPRAVAAAINKDTEEVRSFLTSRENVDNKANVLDELYREKMSKKYNKKHDGATIASHMEPHEMHPEILGFIESLVTVERGY